MNPFAPSPTPAPETWGYGFEASGRAIASYPGDVSAMALVGQNVVYAANTTVTTPLLILPGGTITVNNGVTLTIAADLIAPRAPYST